ncbi:MAG TPA: GxxExxY protein [Saprospiraceae bacterium]|nr:GxxExxY protein [Saprospiraceae bacterium]HPI08766.1 GxxExxY protein [Saprospiraceae bacterium]
MNTNLNALNEISYQIIGAAYKVHSELGPGLLESAYEVCMEYELLRNGLKVERQKVLPLDYHDVQLDAAYKIDMMVEKRIILELKSVEAIAPIHEAQLMTYLKLTKLKLGLLLNFNVRDMKNGIKRIAM